MSRSTKNWYFFYFIFGLLLCFINSTVLVQASDRGIVVNAKTSSGQSKEIELYSGYHALVIGAGAYTEGWPRLPNPVRDAREVAEALQEMGWEVDLVENPDAPRLKRELNKLVVGPGQDPTKAILVWFSGHGHTLEEADGSNLGYIVPVDAPDPDKNLLDFMEKAVSMRRMETVSKHIRSKHLLMIFDSCFSGAIFRLVRAKPSPYIQEKVAYPVREFMTAGSENEQVPDKSVFKTVFLQAVQDGFADSNQDGYVTGEELGAYVQEEVINYTRKAQHPQFGKINNPKLDKGDFIFVKKELSEVEKLRLELERLKKENERLKAKRSQLAEREKTGKKDDEVEKQTGRLYVTPTPSDARVRIMNIVPVYHDGIELDPGEYHIRVDKRGYKTEDRWVDIVDGEKLDVGIELKEVPSSGRLTVRTTPSDAKVRLVNSDRGYRDGMELDAGRYRVEVSRSGYEKVTQWVRLSPGEEKQVRIGLERAGPRPGEPWTEPVTGMEFVWVPGGCYMMGSNEGQSDEKPVHEICVGGFWMGKYEVTQGQWERIMGSNPSHFDRGSNYPVKKVSWNDCQEYIKRMNRRRSGSREFRLPTEAQWEYAARSGGKRQKYAGGSNVDKVAWYRGNSGGRTHRVGTKTANGLGLYDMSGNVWEWCRDMYDSDAYTRHSRNNPVITSGGSGRVYRGGSWCNFPRRVRAAVRYRLDPGLTYYGLGFRLCFPRVR